MINEKNLLTSLVEDSRSLWTHLGRLEKKAPRHSLPHTVRCIVVIVLLFAFTVPVAEAGEQSGDSVSTVESTKVDIAIGHENLLVTKLSDRVFEVTILLRNRGSVLLPRFKVYFYAGDPDKGGRLLSAQNAGPITPGDTWAEYNPGLELRQDENVISVIVDPDNKVEESDETNNKVSKTISTIVSESATVRKIGAIQKVDLAGDDILQVEAQTVEGFNFPYYLFIPGGIDKDKQVYMLVETNNSGMVSDDLEVHQTKALMLVKKSHANRMARQLGVPLLVPTFPRPRPETHWWAYTHALDIDTLEIEEGKLKRIDLQLTSMIKHAQELLRINGFTINDRIFMHGFSASAKFCNRYSFLHPEMVKAAAAGGVNGLPTLPVREWNGYELPFPIGIAGIERFTGKPFDEQAFKQVAHYIYMGSSDRNDTLLSREAWREEEADIIRKALAAEKMMPDRWELSRKIYS
ncbi:MAG: CARDB domain-containing protein, partial [Phycisphaerae bacterium]